jgi:nucleoside-diphosphate-sugar epimerase
MTTKVLVAGAGGTIGRRLCPLLTSAGYAVCGTTRKRDTAAELDSGGVTPIVVDIFDATSLSAMLAEFRPEIVIHQLTDLSGGLDLINYNATIERNARIRIEGTRNLVSAAVAAGARRIIAQSIAWMYVPGPEPHREEDPLDVDAKGVRAITVGGIVALEKSVLSSELPEGIVLRYGRLYGPGSGLDSPAADGSAHVHVDAAAQAALLAIRRGRRGVYNIAEPCVYATSEKAERELGWSAGFRPKRA